MITSPAYRRMIMKQYELQREKDKQRHSDKEVLITISDEQTKINNAAMNVARQKLDRGES